MSEKIDKTLKKIFADTQKESSPNSSIPEGSPERQASEELPGKKDCPYCGGIGLLRFDVPIGHPSFGKLQTCICRQSELSNEVRDKLYSMSNLVELSHLTFENFDSMGHKGVSPVESASVGEAYKQSCEFASNLDGWLLLQGGYGCGKTHLAAAIANQVVALGVPTLFITVPDLLDWLRFAYNDPEVTFEQRFDQVRQAQFLVLDDFGTQNATAWAQEKLFQILNYRYINNLPLVVTTNLSLDEIEGRIRSRLQDARKVRNIHILAPDYRLPSGETSTPGLSSLPLLSDKTFGTFSLREDELNQKVKVTTIIESEDKSGIISKKTQSVITTITKTDLNLLTKAFHGAMEFADDPHGWIVFLGDSGAGKTHLAAAVGNYRVSSGFPALMVDVADLLDYLRATFNPNSAVKYDRRFDEVRTTPLLILDSFGAQRTSPWAEEKLYQILNFRYNAKLPTVITSSLKLEDFEEDFPQILNRLLDSRLCKIYALGMPAYRNFGSSRKGGRRKSTNKGDEVKG